MPEQVAFSLDASTVAEFRGSYRRLFRLCFRSHYLPEQAEHFFPSHTLDYHGRIFSRLATHPLPSRHRWECQYRSNARLRGFYYKVRRNSFFLAADFKKKCFSYTDDQAWSVRNRENLVVFFCLRICMLPQHKKMIRVLMPSSFSVRGGRNSSCNALAPFWIPPTRTGTFRSSPCHPLLSELGLCPRRSRLSGAAAFLEDSAVAKARARAVRTS